jgi:hypothetical protein
VQCAAEGQPGSPAELNEGLASCYCHKHADCTSGLCDVYQTRRPDKVGLCVPARARTSNSLTSSYQLIVYVDRERCQTAGEPDGTLAQPYCEIYDAVNRNLAESFPHPVRVIGSNNVYSGDILRSGIPSPLWIAGPDEGKDAVLGPVKLDGDQFASPIEVTLEGVRIRNNDVTGRYGISCTANTSSPTLRLHRMVISQSTSEPPPTPPPPGALYVSGCTIEVDRTAIINNNSNALILAEPAVAQTKYQITNSIIANNTLGDARGGVGALAAVRLAGTGIFRFNTVVNNTIAQPILPLIGGVDCGPTQKAIENSIVVENPKVLNMQINSCLINEVVVGLGDADAGIRENPVFVNPSNKLPQGLALAPADVACRDQAAPIPSASEIMQLPSRGYWQWSYSGTPRPVGPAADIGAFELQQ